MKHKKREVKYKAQSFDATADGKALVKLSNS